MSHITYKRLEAFPLEENVGRGGSAWLIGLTAASLAIVVSVIVAFVVTHQMYASWNQQNVKTISGVHADPVTNDLDLAVSLGLQETPLLVSNTVLLENTGVVTLNSLASDSTTRNIDVVGTAPAVVVASAGSTVTLSSPAVCTINGAAAVANDFLFDAGPGLSRGTAGHTVTYSNTGVLALAAGTGIAVNASTGNVQVSNTGVLTVNGLAPSSGNIVVDAGDGLAIQSSGNTVTLSDALATATTLDDTSAGGPLVRYESAIGFFVPVVENSGWRTGLAPGFPLPYVPGAVNGDSGMGDTGSGTGWAVPALGTYTVNADCEIIPDNIAVNDRQVVSVAMSLGAQSEDPLALAVIPAGGYVSLDLSGGTNANVAAPTLPPRVSLSGTFQAGCTNCPVQLGDALQFHVMMERTGTQPGPYSVSAYCTFEVAKIR